MSEKPSNEGGYVVTQKTEDGAETVIVTGEGVSVHRFPGGLTEDDLLP